MKMKKSTEGENAETVAQTEGGQKEKAKGRILTGLCGI